MSESKTYWLIVIGVFAFIAYLAWISLWFLLLLPVAIFIFITFEENYEIQERNKELELKLTESEDRFELYRDEFRDAKYCNEKLRHRLRQLEDELQKLNEDPDAEMKQIELNAEREITGGV